MILEPNDFDKLYKCNLCGHSEYIHVDEITDGFDESADQQEFFYEHLAIEHNIERQIIGISTLNEMLNMVYNGETKSATIDEINSTKIFAYQLGGIELSEYFTCIEIIDCCKK